MQENRIICTSFSRTPLYMLITLEVAKVPAQTHFVKIEDIFYMFGKVLII